MYTTRQGDTVAREGEADNIATIQESTVAQQVHATRAREAQARTTRAWEAQARSAQRMQEHLGACGGVNEKGNVSDGDERSPQGLDERSAPSRCRRR